MLDEKEPLLEVEEQDATLILLLESPFTDVVLLELVGVAFFVLVMEDAEDAIEQGLCICVVGLMIY